MSSNQHKSRHDRDRDYGIGGSSSEDYRTKDLWTRDDVFEQLDDLFGPSSSSHNAKSSKTKQTKATKTKSRSSTKASASQDAVCPVCGSMFTRRSNMYKHVRSVHSSTRDYMCKICGFPFTRQDHLDKHIRTVHDGVKSFACDICGDLFSEKYNRDKHKEKVHETKRPYRCRCGSYFQGLEKMRNCLRCNRN